jgi:hypothetical protein
MAVLLQRHKTFLRITRAANSIVSMDAETADHDLRMYFSRYNYWLYYFLLIGML